MLWMCALSTLRLTITILLILKDLNFFSISPAEYLVLLLSLCRNISIRHHSRVSSFLKFTHFSILTSTLKSSQEISKFYSACMWFRGTLMMTTYLWLPPHPPYWHLPHRSMADGPTGRKNTGNIVLLVLLT